MKLTEKGKEVWGSVTVTHATYPNLNKAGVSTYGGIPFGWTVARGAMKGILGNSEILGLSGIAPNEYADQAYDYAIALCNKLAEVENEGP